MRVLVSRQSTERPRRERRVRVSSQYYSSNSCPSGPIWCEVANMPYVPCTWNLPIPTGWMQKYRSEPAFKATNNILINGLGGGCSNQYQIRVSRTHIGYLFKIKVLTESIHRSLINIYILILQYIATFAQKTEKYSKYWSITYIVIGPKITGLTNTKYTYFKN